MRLVLRTVIVLRTCTSWNILFFAGLFKLWTKIWTGNGLWITGCTLCTDDSMFVFEERLIALRKGKVVVQFFTMAFFLMILHMIGPSTFVTAFLALKGHKLKKCKTHMTKNRPKNWPKMTKNLHLSVAGSGVLGLLSEQNQCSGLFRFLKS